MANKATTSWRGAIEFSGFPVNVALYTRVKKQRTESFRTLAKSDGLPIRQQNVDHLGNVCGPEAVSKGVPAPGAKDQWVAMTEEALEQINEGAKSIVIQPDAFCPVDTVPLDLAIERYAVRADDKVPGASQSVNIIWNGLRTTGLAYISTITTRAGGHDSILAIYANDEGMWAAALPFTAELYDVPAGDFVEDEAAAAMFSQVMEQQEVEPFNHQDYESEYAARRADAIAAVLAGNPVVSTAPSAPTTTVPDLMSVLSAAVSDVKTKKAPAKKPAKAKVAA